MAIAFPLLNLLQYSPEFFVARQSQASDILLLVFTISLVLPAILFLLQALLAGIHARLGLFLYCFCIALLFVFWGLSVFSGIPVAWLHGVLALLAGITATWLYFRTRAGRLFVTFLVVSVVLVPASFLLDADILDLLKPVEKPAADLSMSGGDLSPIVFVVFDEFPTVALLGPDGEIDKELFPNFHALAMTSDWYPYATTVATSTVTSIPAILTGQYPREYRSPNEREFPQNLFTWLGHNYDFNVLEAVSAMCPERLCGQQRRMAFNERFRGLLWDVTAVYFNIVAADFNTGLFPDVSRSWKDFWGDDASGKGMYVHRLQQMEEFVGRVSQTEKPGLDFSHLNFPHIPYEFLPDGRRYQDGWLMPGVDIEEWAWLSDGEWASVQAYQRFLLQLQAADAWLGKLMARLRGNGLFDRSILVVTADHGVSFTPGSSIRDAPPLSNLDENILPVPLFIKSPHQETGKRDDGNAETIDILPTIAELLEQEIPWAVDGVSLISAEKPAGKRAIYGNRDMKVYMTGLSNVKQAMGDHLKQRYFDAASGTESLFRAGPFPQLFATKLSEIELSESAEFKVRFQHAETFENVDIDSGFLPAHLSGELEWPGEEVNFLAIVLNGEIVASTQVWRDGDSLQFSAMLPPDRFRPGKNQPGVLAIRETRDGEFEFVVAHNTQSDDDYSWNESTGVFSRSGYPLLNDQVGIRGSLDQISRNSKSIEVMGWGIDSSHSAPLRHIVVFDHETMVYAGKTRMLRGEVRHFEVGFHAVIPLSQLEDREQPKFRIFAVTTDDRYLELHEVVTES